MKYSVMAVEQLAPMDDAELLARVAAFEQVHDAFENGCDSTALEVYENLQELKNRIIAKDPKVSAFISSQPELVDMLQEAGSIENFKLRIDRELAAAQEGFGKDLLWEGLIGAILHRNDTQLKHLEPLVPQLIKQVSEADEKKFGEWKFLRQINVFSKYLPDQKDWAPAAKALKAAAAYLSTVNPNNFDAAKFSGFFQGTVYANKKGKVGTTTTIGTSFFGLATKDIRKRGWTEKNHFLTALKDMKDIIEAMKKMQTAIEKNKNAKVDEANKSVAKECSKALTMTVNLCGHLGRGITAAASKISGSIWKRLFTTEM